MAVKKYTNDAKKAAHDVARKLNAKLSLPEGVNFEGERTILDFGLNPRTEKFLDMVRHFSVCHIMFQLGQFTQENNHIRIFDAGTGCGECYGVLSVMRKAAGVTMDYIGIDVDLRKNEIAKLYYPKLDYRLCDFTIQEELDEAVPEDNFDIALSTEVLEHLLKEDGENYLRFIYNKLKPGGYFILTTPNEEKQSTNPWHRYEWPNKELSGFVTETLGYEVIDQFFMRPDIRDVEKAYEGQIDKLRYRVPTQIIRACLMHDEKGAIQAYVLRKPMEPAESAS